MGLLIEGRWSDQWYDTKSTKGEFVRQASQFHCPIDSETGTVDDNFVAESGRYHLFVSLACPWAHRTLIFRKLKKLEEHIGVTVVQAEMLENGWELPKALSESDKAQGYELSPVPDIDFLYQLYTTENPQYSGRVTVPVLWDKKTQSIICNESSEIIRLLNGAFNHLEGIEEDINFWPLHLREQIENINASIYDNINNGVYKTGFATTQTAYELNFNALFAELDKVEKILSDQRYLVWDEEANSSILTEADWRLFTTLIRFDAVYVGHFKCNRQRIEDYPHLSNYLRDLYQVNNVADTVDFFHIKHHYYASHTTINPTRIVPLGPDIDFNRPHNRENLS